MKFSLPAKTLLSIVIAVVIHNGSAQAQTNPGKPSVEEKTASKTSPDITRLETLVVSGHRIDQIGQKLSAAEGTIGSADIEARPVLRTGEILEFVPGMVVTQHSGSGKANQYFLRGFNLDHGTDFNSSIDGMPINMRTHGHGQGYTDLNFIIPELIGSIDYRKGPYYAEVGDFSGAGAAAFKLKHRLDKNLLALTGGENNYGRLLGVGSIELTQGRLLIGAERLVSDGPWTSLNEEIDKTAVNAGYINPLDDGNFTLTFMGYDNSWNSPDQIPARAVEQGIIDDFGSLNTTNGGKSSRYSLSSQWNNQNWNANAYVVHSDLQLISDFTYFLEDPVKGDQYKQLDERNLYGGALSYQWDSTWLEKPALHKLGTEVRYDDIGNVGLYKTRAREYLSTVREDSVDEGSIGIYAQTTLTITERFSTHIGGRYDYFAVDVDSNIADNSGDASQGKFSVKAGATYLFNNQLEGFINAGQGFHSNDARGATLKVDPISLEAADAVELIVPSRGAELGVRWFDQQQFNISASLWYLESESELIFIGDAGHNEASRASKRTGIEIASYFWFDSNWNLDMELAWTRARFNENTRAEGKYVDGSVPFVASTGITYGNTGDGLHASLRYRHFGARVLESFNQIKADSTSTWNLGAGYAWDKFSLELEIHNLLDSKEHDIDYYYASRLPGEPDEGVEDLHYHPAEPRTVRARVEYRF